MKSYLLALFLVISISLNAQDYKLEGNEVKIEKPVLFETASDKQIGRASCRERV